MNSKYSNQDLINATLEIYNEFEPSQTKEITKKIKEKIIEKPKPLLLTKEITKKSKTKKNKSLNDKSLIDGKISNNQRLAAYKKRKRIYNKTTLILNKIIKFENNKYLLLDKIKNSNLKIIKMKTPNL
ncbi:MAG: hypothetical protein EVA55_03115 [alpha proteobacterium HIMB114]|nr:MAG: hypothetical protein EVA55_03115 [alpha proteobacterium HIMB114]